MSADLAVFPSEILFEQTESHVHIEFTSDFNLLSSAVLNGGFQDVKHIVNLKVPIESCSKDKPEDTLNRYCAEYQWQGKTASMQSLSIRQANIENISIMAIVTAGLSNPRRAGDYADCRTLLAAALKHDTINIILISTASFTPAAMVEAIMIITEAKVAALQNANVKSPVSGLLATGTGTDSIVLATEKADKPSIEFCGKHTLMGELIAQLVIEAVTESINWDMEHNDYYKLAFLRGK